MKMTITLFEKTFKDKSLSVKEAYLKACKWVAKNVLTNEKLKDVLVEYKIEKTKAEVTLILHCFLESEDERKRYCSMCKEFHESVFTNCSYNCNNCNLIALNKRQNTRLKVKKEYYGRFLPE